MDSRLPFNDWKDKILAAGNEIEKLITLLPEIAEAEAERMLLYEDKVGWLLLKDFFNIWLSAISSSNSPEPCWISMDWILEYARARMAFQQITDPSYLATPKSLERLADILKKKGYFGTEERSFDFTKISKENWTDFNDSAFQYVVVPGMANFYPDGLMAALGGFQFRALPGGKVVPLGNGTYKIVITKLSIFAEDTFNFADDQSYLYWNPETREFSPYKKKGSWNLQMKISENFPKTRNMGKISKSLLNLILLKTSGELNMLSLNEKYYSSSPSRRYLSPQALDSCNFAYISSGRYFLDISLSCNSNEFPGKLYARPDSLALELYRSSANRHSYFTDICSGNISLDKDRGMRSHAFGFYNGCCAFPAIFHDHCPHNKRNSLKFISSHKSISLPEAA